MKVSLLVIWMSLNVMGNDTQKSCDFMKLAHYGDKLKMHPSCSARRPVGILTNRLLQTVQHCFRFACDLQANVIYYEEGFQCQAHRCGSNANDTDWDITWDWEENQTDRIGQVYIFPHPNTPKCYSSYFAKRPSKKGMKAGCQTTSNNEVNNLKECMERACEEKANIFNYIDSTEPPQCEPMHCQWDAANDDYDLRPIGSKNIDIQIYGLCHSGFDTSKSCNSMTWSDSVMLPMIQPVCGLILSTYENSSIFKNSELMCELGANTFQNHAANFGRILASKCESNAEGTDWKYYDDNIIPKPDEPLTEWLNVPHPGTPNCGSSIFRIRSIGAQRQMSNCTLKRKIPEAKDLRQCMLYACELNYTVINYFSDSYSVVCELRECDKLDEDYDFKYGVTDGKRYDVYALHYDERESPVLPSVSTTLPTTTVRDNNCVDVNKLECSCVQGIALTFLGCFITAIIISVITCIYRDDLKTWISQKLSRFLPSQSTHEYVQAPQNGQA
ncbi:unnamed protein product, partial [Owenia fusiformis]